MSKIKSLQSLCLVIVALTIGIFFCVNEANASTDLPLGHWAYDALEDLVLLGVTDLIGLSTRPMSRVAVARKIAGIIKEIQDEELKFSVLRDEAAIDRAETMLYALMDEFEDELTRLGVDVVIKEDKSFKVVSLRLFDTMRKELKYTLFSESTIKQISLENERGWVLEEEANTRISIGSWISIEDVLGLRVEPVFYGSKDKNNITLDEAFISANYANICAGVGRTSMWWGPGHHGTMLLSNNVRPLYLAKIGSTSPFRLPYLGELGLWNISFFTAKLIEENNRNIEEPYLSGLKLEYSPHKRLNLGFTHTVMWGGEGARDVSFTDFLDMFFAKLGGGADEDENHLMSFTGEWAVPGLNEILPVADGALLYCEIGAEDERNGLPDAIGGLVGIRLIDIFASEGLDFITEYARTDDTWYTHYAYRNGYDSRGNILGHHVGTDGDDIFVSITKKFGKNFNAGLTFDAERHGLTKSVVEKKYEAGIDIKYQVLENAFLNAEYEFEYFDAYQNTSGQTAKNHILAIGGEIEF